MRAAGCASTEMSQEQGRLGAELGCGKAGQMEKGLLSEFTRLSSYACISVRVQTGQSPCSRSSHEWV